jgi:hypothetical protein
MYLQIKINFITTIACFIASATFYTAKNRDIKKYFSLAIKY